MSASKGDAAEHRVVLDGSVRRLTSIEAFSGHGSPLGEAIFLGRMRRRGSDSLSAEGRGRGCGTPSGSVEEGLWPLVETFLGSHDAAGLAVAVVREEEVVSRGFGVGDVGSGASVTPETMFHLAPVSKPSVATAIVSLATAGDSGEPVLDLDAPIIEWVPEFYSWHDPQLGVRRTSPPWAVHHLWVR